MQVAWLGLGAMGRPMAANLAEAHDTRVWNRTAGVAEEHAAAHATTALSGLDGLVGVDAVLSCLPTTTEVVEVVRAAVGHLAPGTLWIDCTSGDPAASRELALELAEAGVAYLDAPVSGGTDGAEAGTLTIMLGAPDDEHAEQARTVLGPCASRIVHVGPVGSGHAVKAVNNTLLAANLWAAGEGLVALASLGVDPALALEVINGSSGRSFATERLIPERVVTRAFPNTFALPLLAKDTRLGLDVVADAGTPAPALRLVRDLAQLAAGDLGDVDHSALLRLLERWAGRDIAPPT
jgi:3-hydroxyisobutyrate dehydrogenase